MPEAVQTSTQQRRALALLSVPVLLFGTAWPVNKLALAGMPPLWFAAGRVAVAILARSPVSPPSAAPAAPPPR